MEYDYLIVWLAPNENGGCFVGDILWNNVGHEFNQDDYNEFIVRIKQEKELLQEPTILNVIRIAKGDDN